MDEISENIFDEELKYLNVYNMEIQNKRRRNSEYALIESQGELESQRQSLEAHQSKFDEKECICAADWR